MGYCLEEFFEDVILPSKSLEDLKVNLGRMPREDYLYLFIRFLLARGREVDIEKEALHLFGDYKEVMLLLKDYSGIKIIGDCPSGVTLTINKPIDNG